MTELQRRIKALTQKNTLLKNAQATLKAIFIREYFFLQPKKNFKIFSQRFKKIKTPHRTVLTRTDIASNVNCFGQSVCGLDTTDLRTDSRAAHNSTSYVKQ